MRRDDRQIALVATLAAPLMGEGYHMPSLRYPYECDGGIEIDSEATLEALANYQARIYG